MAKINTLSLITKQNWQKICTSEMDSVFDGSIMHIKGLILSIAFFAWISGF